MWVKLARLVRNPKTGPWALGLPFGLFLAVAMWKLLSDRHPLGVVCIVIWAALSSFWMRDRIYQTITIAWFVGTSLALIFWKP
jgi:hypothetical protein